MKTSCHGNDGELAASPRDAPCELLRVYQPPGGISGYNSYYVPSKMPFFREGSEPLPNKRFLGATRVNNPRCELIGSSDFAGLTAETNRQTTLLRL